MRVADSVAQARTILQSCKQQRIALVPTMGCLHDGHMQLIEQAKQRADYVVVSIYVNPLQFGAGEDLARYPRTFEQDHARCLQAGVNLIFHPENLYPMDGSRITLKVDGLDNCLCGASRPGHFDGVVTVVNMLFNIIQPDIAIFGEKDWQQLAIIRRMVSDLHMNVNIEAAPIVREADGLAMSSRNRYLIPEQRQQATHLFKALQAIAVKYQTGEKQAAILCAEAEQLLHEADIHPEYLEIRDSETLQPLTLLTENSKARAFVAAPIGAARLIDNIAL